MVHIDDRDASLSIAELLVVKNAIIDNTNEPHTLKVMELPWAYSMKSILYQRT